MAAVADVSATRAAAKWIAPSDAGNADRYVWLELDQNTRRVLGIFKGAA